MYTYCLCISYVYMRCIIIIMSRDRTFLRSKLIQVLLSAVVAGSLFNNIETANSQTMFGFLFLCSVTSAMGNISMLPAFMAQRDTYYKQCEASFFPTVSYVCAQAVTLYPLHILESVLFSVITYWSAGLTESISGSHFFIFMLLLLCFSVLSAQMFRFIGSLFPSVTIAQPIAGVVTLMMGLFCG